MSEPAIRVHELGKRYRIGEQNQYRTLRDAIPGGVVKAIRGLVAGTRGGDGQRTRSIWAIRDLSFDLQAGETLGVIGRNGSGKSTLLKVLSRITRPTEGWAEVRGRVGSLLEVGTGFHMELSGRENIYLSGAILGMARSEIVRRFDEIVAFSEVEKFLDTPVKHYSSGMYVRLAFAVAAHLETEILIVDEVLAVGDLEFQRKCVGKMKDVAGAGRTVLFVSHNMSAILSLCRSAILLDNGRLMYSGDASSTVSHYLDTHSSVASFSGRKGTPEQRLCLTAAAIKKNGVPCSTFRSSEKAEIWIEFEVFKAITGAQIAFELTTELGETIFVSTSMDTADVQDAFHPGHHVVRCEVRLAELKTGRYRIGFYASIPKVVKLDEMPEALALEVVDDTTPVARLGHGRRGLIVPCLPWELVSRP